MELLIFDCAYLPIVCTGPGICARFAPVLHRCDTGSLSASGFDDLSTDEKIDYLALLWDRIITRPTTIDIPERHLEVIAAP